MAPQPLSFTHLTERSKTLKDKYKLIAVWEPKRLLILYNNIDF